MIDRNDIDECIHPDGHIWVTLENIITDNGIEIYTEEKCEFCDQEQTTGVKP